MVGNERRWRLRLRILASCRLCHSQIRQREELRNGGDVEFDDVVGHGSALRSRSFGGRYVAGRVTLKVSIATRSLSTHALEPAIHVGFGYPPEARKRRRHNLTQLFDEFVCRSPHGLITLKYCSLDSLYIEQT